MGFWVGGGERGFRPTQELELSAQRSASFQSTLQARDYIWKRWYLRSWNRWKELHPAHPLGPAIWSARMALAERKISPMLNEGARVKI